MNTTRTARLICHASAVGTAVTLVVLLAASSGPALGDGRHDLTTDAQVLTSEAMPSPEEAVRIAVEASGTPYAGQCAASRSPQDIGKTCATFVAERDGLRAYLGGRTFSEYSRWMFVAHRQTGWIVVGTAPLDYFAPSLEIPWPR